MQMVIVDAANDHTPFKSSAVCWQLPLRMVTVPVSTTNQTSIPAGMFSLVPDRSAFRGLLRRSAVP